MKLLATLLAAALANPTPVAVAPPRPSIGEFSPRDDIADMLASMTARDAGLSVAGEAALKAHNREWAIDVVSDRESVAEDLARERLLELFAQERVDKGAMKRLQDDWLIAAMLRKRREHVKLTTMLTSLNVDDRRKLASYYVSQSRSKRQNGR